VSALPIALNNVLPSHPLFARHFLHKRTARLATWSRARLVATCGCMENQSPMAQGDLVLYSLIPCLAG
jgi:hypothetical protein